MTKESTGKVLAGILNDAEAASQVAGGDYTSFADEDLTDAERALLEAAAGELDEADVAGFAVFAKYDGIDGESLRSGLGGFDLTTYPKVELVVNYYKLGR